MDEAKGGEKAVAPNGACASQQLILCSRTATPATWGVAMDVPDHCWYTNSPLPLTAVESTRLPGATSSIWSPQLDPDHSE
jgi:hypothetical protein